jgi:MFS family permease
VITAEAAAQPGGAPRLLRIEPGGLSRRRAWLIVLAIGWTLTMACALAWYALALYLNALVTSRGFALTGVSFAISTFFLASSVSNVPLGWLIRRVEPRWIMVAGSAVSGLSLVLLGRVDAVWQLYVVFTILGCGFSASSYLPGTTVIVSLFGRDPARVKALAVALTGGSASGVVLAPVMARILDAYGLTGAAPWLGLAYLVLVGSPMVAVVRGHLAGPAPGSGPVAPGAAQDVSYGQAVRSAPFFLVIVYFAVLMANQGGIQVEVVSIGSAMGVSGAGIAISILAFAIMAGRLVGAFTLTRVPVLRVCAAAGVLQAASFAVLALLHGLSGLAAGIVLFGITAGNLSVLFPLIIVELFGLSDYPRIYAVGQFASSLGTAAGPAALAALHGGLGGYRFPLLILAAVSTLAAAAATRLRRPDQVPATGPAPEPEPEPEPAQDEPCVGSAGGSTARASAERYSRSSRPSP